jgi:hypothetical protein
VLAYGTPIVLAAVVGGFGYFLLRGPQENLNPWENAGFSASEASSRSLSEIKQETLESTSNTPAVVPSSLLGIPAKPKPEPELQKPEAPMTISPMDVAKMELDQIEKASGPLYNERSTNLAIKFGGVSLTDPEAVKAREVVKSFQQAKSHQERLAFVFNAKKCAPLMQEHYEKRAEKDPECGQMLGAGYITTGSSKVLYLILECAARPDSGMRANFHFTKTGKPMLDWESWAAWCEMSWADLKKERPQRSVLMRAVASESSYYNYEFSEDWRWLAVKLRSADGLQTVTGYVSRDSVAGIAMANLIGVALPHNLPPETPLPQMRGVGAKSLVTVRLAYPPSSQSDHCVKISELMADRWLLFPGEEK